MARLLGATLVGLAVALIWAVSASANVSHAYQLAGEGWHAHIFAAASGSSDALKAGAAVAIGIAFRQRAVGACAALLIIWIATTSWSVRSAIGFASHVVSDRVAERVTEARLSESVHSEVLQTQLALQAARERALTAKYQSRRADASAEAERLQERLDWLRKTHAKSRTIEADPVATLLRRSLGWSEETSRQATILALVMLLEITSNLGFLAFAPLLRRQPPPEPDKPPDDKVMADIFAQCFVKPRDEASLEQQKPSVAWLPEPRPEPPEPRPEPPPRLKEDPAHGTIYYRRLVHDRGGQTVDRDELYAHYDGWTAAKRVEPLPRNELMKALKAAGLADGPRRRSASGQRTRAYIVPETVSTNLRGVV